MATTEGAVIYFVAGIAAVILLAVLMNRRTGPRKADRGRPFSPIFWWDHGAVGRWDWLPWGGYFFRWTGPPKDEPKQGRSAPPRK